MNGLHDTNSRNVEHDANEEKIEELEFASPPVSGSSAQFSNSPAGGENLADYCVLSDEELAFLNEEDEEDASRSELDRLAAAKSTSHPSLSLNMSSTTTTTSTAGGQRRDNPHGDVNSNVERNEDTSTSYNTEDGYADDESELRKVNARIAQELSVEPPEPPPQLQPNPVSPSRYSFPRSATTSPSIIPPSASLFRYLRSWGRANQDAPAGVEGSAVVDHTVVAGVGELSSDDDDEEISLSQAESSWADEDDLSDASIYANEHGKVWEEPVDWSHLPLLPNRFCVTFLQQQTTDNTGKAPSALLAATTHCDTAPPQYLDASLLHNASSLSVSEANEFVWEHGALLQAVLQLLAERDQVGVEGSTDSTENIWRKGPLKKLSFSVGRRKHQRPAVAGAWNVKYVELRHGNLCYYDDTAGTGRKTIHLRQADTLVQESLYRGPGFVFELLVQGSPTRYWMASSEEERQAWMKAIQAAMIGIEAPRKELDLQPYEESLSVYESLRASLQLADSQELYLIAIHAAMKELARLQVPVQWVQERIENDLSPILLGTLKPPKFSRSPQKLLKSSISEFWKNMSQTTFSINGFTVPKASQFASERIVGALTRCILEFDKAFVSADEREDGAEVLLDSSQLQISELQAISYARHILLTVLRSRERLDATLVVRYLLENPGVMVSEQSPTSDNENPVNIEVSFAGEDLPDEFLHTEEKTSWVWTRTRRKHQSAIAASVSTGKWTQRHTFAVLSGTVLSYYAAASPRPHGLRGQLVLNASNTVREEGEEVVTESGDGGSNVKSNGVRYVLCISSESHADWLLLFERQADVAAWKEAIQLTIDSAGSIQNPPSVVTTTTTTTLMAPVKILKGAERAIKVAADGTIQGGIRVIKGAKDSGIRVMKGAKYGGIRVIKTATGSGFKVIRGAVGMLRQSKSVEYDEQNLRRPSLQMLFNNTIVHGKREPTVQCVFQTTQTFTLRNHTYTEHESDQGTESGTGDDDGWMSVKVKLYQAFLMSGGPSGRIARGDALVELDFVETKVEMQDDDASG